MSFMPNPGSFVLLESGLYGIVTNVTPDGEGDSILVLGAAGSWHLTGKLCVDRIQKVITEPEAHNTGRERSLDG